MSVRYFEITSPRSGAVLYARNRIEELSESSWYYCDATQTLESYGEICWPLWYNDFIKLQEEFGGVFEVSLSDDERLYMFGGD